MSIEYNNQWCKNGAYAYCETFNMLTKKYGGYNMNIKLMKEVLCHVK